MELVRVRAEPSASLRGSELPLRLRLPPGKPAHVAFVSDLAATCACTPKELQAAVTRAGLRPVVAKLEGTAGEAAAPQLALPFVGLLDLVPFLEPPARASWMREFGLRSYAVALLKLHKAEEEAEKAAAARPAPCREAWGGALHRAAAGSPPPAGSPGSPPAPAAGPAEGGGAELPEPLVHRALTLEERLAAERLMAKIGAVGHNLQCARGLRAAGRAERPQRPAEGRRGARPRRAADDGAPAQGAADGEPGGAQREHGLFSGGGRAGEGEGGEAEYRLFPAEGPREGRGGRPRQALGLGPRPRSPRAPLFLYRRHSETLLARPSGFDHRNMLSNRSPSCRGKR